MITLKNQDGKLELVEPLEPLKMAVMCSCGACIEISVSCITPNTDITSLEGLRSTIMTMITEHPGMSGRGIARRLDLSYATVAKVLRGMAKEGLIHRKVGAWGLYPGGEWYCQNST